MIIRKLSDNTKVYIDRYFAIVDEMAENMRAIEASESITEIFIKQMIALHEGGVKMSENILNYTTNSNIESLSKNIVKASNDAIEKLSNMLESCSQSKINERDLTLYQRRFTSLLDSMVNSMNNINVTNNIEIDFLSGMIPHHEGEIAMSKNVLGYEICDELKDFSENLITTHELEVSQMRQLLRMLS